MNENFSNKIVNIIKSRRVMLGYSQDYMAMKLNISQNSYSKIEIGKTQIELNRLLSICKLLDLSVGSLLSEAEATLALAQSA